MRGVGDEGESGFTLVELLMVIAMTGIITAAIGMAFTVGLRNTGVTGDRLSQSVDTQLVAAYFPQDVQSAGRAAGDVVWPTMPAPVLPDTAGCSGVTGNNVLALKWRETVGATTENFGATYRTTTVDGEARLVRYACGPTGTTLQVLARDVTTPAGATASVQQDIIRLSLTMDASTEAAAYTTTVVGTRRTPAPVVYTPPTTCTITALSLSPPSGSMAAGVLLPPPVLTATGTPACGAIKASYQPDSTSVDTALVKTGNNYAGTLASTGWTTGTKTITLIDTSSGDILSSLPFNVTAAAPCTVSNLVTSPGSGTRSRNPSAAPLVEGAVTVTADFGPTCGSGLVLAYDTASNTTAPTASQLTFPAIGLTRSVAIPSTGNWTDGEHHLVVKTGATALTAGVLVVTPRACSATSLDVNETELNNNGSGSKLNKSPVVTVVSQGVCAGLQVSFTPDSTPQTLPLSPSANFSSWTVTVDKDGFAWSEGTKTFTALTDLGLPFNPTRQDTMTVK